jgi:SAM-dependent methyltransferase
MDALGLSEMTGAGSGLQEVARAFPYPARLTRAQQARISSVTEGFLRWCPPPAYVADLGTGMAALPAVLREVGYEAVGVDDYSDPWHQPDVVDRLTRFSLDRGFSLVRSSIEAFVPDRPLDGVSLVDVIEHLHDSPRPLLNRVGEFLAPGGVVLVVMPSSVNLRKRIAVARGRTCYPALEEFFNASGPWRGHVREYTPREGAELMRMAGFEVLEMTQFDAILYDRIGSRIAQTLFRGLSSIWPNLKDSFLVVGRKPSHWRPSEARVGAGSSAGEH